MLNRFVRPFIATIPLWAALLGCAPGDVPLDDEGASDRDAELEECPTSLRTALDRDAWNVLNTGARMGLEAGVLEGAAAIAASPAPKSCFRSWANNLWFVSVNGLGARVLEPMIAAGLDPNLTDIDINPLCAGCTGVRRGMTTLHYATREARVQTHSIQGLASPEERVAMVRVLLEMGAEPNAVCSGALYSGGNAVGSEAIGGATPLMFTAAWDDHAAALEATELLLSGGADVSVRAWSVVRSGFDGADEVVNGDTALSIARRGGNAALVDRLLSAGAVDWDLEAEVRAAESSSTEEIAEILTTKIVDHERIWSLWFDAYPQHDTMKPQLDAGLNPNAHTWGAKYSPVAATVFQAAVYAKRPPDELRAVVEAGADVDEGGPVGMPPLVVVIDQYEDYRYLEVLGMLLDAGASVEGRAADGDTPLLRVMYTQRGLDVEDLLLGAGADPNAQNDVGQRPLSVAIRAPKYLIMVDRLLAHGASLNADIDGAPLWASALEHNPLYVSDPGDALEHLAKVGPILDRFVNYPGLVINLSAPAVEKALNRADSNPLVKPYADVIRARADVAPTCGHPLCESGASLAAGCDACAESICAEDPYCCDQAWDSVCVSEVASVCGASCD